MRSVDRFIAINVIVFLYLFIMTEILSLCNSIKRESVIVGWILFIVVCLFYLINRKMIKRAVFSEYFKRESKLVKWLLLCCAGMIVLMGLLAVSTVPSNWDSMTYHCSRIMNWLQNNSVNYYPTNIIRQLYYSPFTEYVCMHVYLIVDNDIAFNLVQWYAYALNALLVFSILRKFDVSKELSLLASLVSLTMPIAIAESITTQTDLFSSMWVLFFLYYIIDFFLWKEISFEKEKLIKLILIACIIGLGYLTKLNICIIFVGLYIYLLFKRIAQKDSIAVLIEFSLMALGIVICIITPSCIRNYISVGDLFATNVFDRIIIETVDIRYVFMNICKNWAQTSIAHKITMLNDFVYAGINAISGILHVDIDNSAITYSSTFGNSFTPSYHCDKASAPIVAYGLLLSEIVFLFSKFFGKIKKQKLQDLKKIFLLLIIIYFAVVKWQPWVTRLLLPTYYLMIICIITNFSRISCSSKKWNISYVVFSLFLLGLATFAVKNQARSMLDYVEHGNRFKMYFHYRDEYEEYSEIIGYIREKGYENIGFYLGEDTYEYPLWVGLKTENTYIIQVVPDNEEKSISPDCIICIHSENFAKDETLIYQEEEYICVFNAGEGDDYAILERR